MSESATERLLQLLHRSHVSFTSFEHSPCRTSVESAAMRSAHGYPNAVGAKALLIKLYPRKGSPYFGVLALPGARRLDTPALLQQCPEIKKLRFATKSEMLELTGLQPGMMPPVGSLVFERNDAFYIDATLHREPLVGFNAASLTRSVVMSGHDLVRAMGPDGIHRFAGEKIG